MKNAIFVFAFFAALFLAACSVFEEEELIPNDFLKTNDNLKVWKLKSFLNNGTDILSDCLTDDTFTFDEKGGEYRWNKNAKTCYEGDKDEVQTFIFSEDRKTMKINGADFEVTQIDHGNLKIKIQLSSALLELWYVPV